MRFLLFLALFGQPFADGTWRVIQSFDAPNSVPGGLAWDGQYLWHSQWHNTTLYKLDSRNGSTLGSLTTDIGYQEDMVFHDGSLYVCDGSRNVIERINPSSGVLEETMNFDWTPYPRDNTQQWGYILNGLTSDGRYLWANLGGVWVVQINPETRQIIHSWKRRFGATNDYLDGMAMAWGSLFIATNGSNIFEVDPCTGAMISQFKAPAGQGLGPEGLTFDGEYLWYTDNTSDMIYKIELIDDYLTRERRLARSAINCNSDAQERASRTAVPAGPGIRLFPNPLASSRPLSVELTGSAAITGRAHIMISDLRGRIVWSGTLQAQSGIIELPGSLFSKWNQGLYLCRCLIGHRTFQKQLLIVR